MNRLILAVLTLGLLVTGASAATITVPGDYTTIQAAIDAANAGDTIDVAAGTYAEQITINKFVKIDGAGSGADPLSNTIITGGSPQVIVVGASGASTLDPVLLKDLRVETSSYAINFTGTLVQHVRFENVSAQGVDPTDDTESNIGIKVSTTASVDDLQVVDCAFDHFSYGWYFAKHGDWGPGGSNVTNVTVQNTSFSFNQAKGLYVEKLANASFSGCSIVSNGQDSGFWNGPWNGGFDINLKGEETYENYDFIGCTFQDNGLNAKEGVGLTVKGRDDGATYGAHPASVDDVLVQDCTFDGNERGLRFGEPNAGNLTPTNAVVTGCLFQDNDATYTGGDGSAYGDLINMTSAPTLAEYNWWNGTAPVRTFGDVDAIPYWGDAAKTILLPAPLVVDAGWEAFIIRENATDGPPFLWGNNNYVANAVEVVTFAGSQKAGIGTNLINGAMVQQISTLHIDRLDDVPNSGSLYGPYFNIWITDGLGNYAVIANEPSNPSWAGSRWDVPDWDFLKTKVAKVYETPGWNTDSSWVHAIAGADPLTFEDVGALMIAPPPPSYIQNGANAVGSGAPDELGTDIAYGFNWIFGDTAANYVTGGGEGFVVDNYTATVDLPVDNVTQGTDYGTIQAAIDAANPGDEIHVESGTYDENVTVDKSLTLLGANAGVACGARGAESVISPASGLPVNITADGVVFNGFEVTTTAYQYGIILSGTSDVQVVYNNVHDINSSATPVIANSFGIYYSVPNGDANSNVTIADNCIDNIASSNVTGSSCAAIAVLQSTSTGTLSDLVISGNTITDVNVNTGSWPTGKIAYGIQLNTGSNSYLSTTGKIVDAVIEDNEISGLSGFISTAIGLEGNTENAYVSGNVIANLYGAKTANRAGGGYDLNGIKFESNRYVGTVTVEYNSVDRTTFNHDGTMDRGYAVANYVPVGDAYTGGTTSAATVTCNWFGTADAGAIADVADLSGAILNKDGAETGFVPFLVTSDIGTPDCSGGSSVATLPAVSGPINCDETVVLSIDYTPDGLTPGLRGYSVTLGATAGVLSFGAGDITISNALDPTDSGADLPQIVDNLDGTFTVDNGILGATSGLTSTATLFTVEINPVATGSGTVDLLDVTLRDVDNVGIPTSISGAAITVDCTAPPAATAYTAAPGPNMVRLNWTMDDPSDVDHYELWRAVWHTGDNTTSAYPEYDDLHGPVLRQNNYADITGSAEWTEYTLTTVPGTATSFNLDDALTRGIYWYELFAVDAAGNVSPMTAEYVRATNYFLGDFKAPVGAPGPEDISWFGSAYGTTQNTGDTYADTDIGPTDDFTGLGIPTTDNVIGFEDLMIMALNYQNVSKQDAPAIPASVALSWNRIDEDTWALELLEPCEGLLGLNVRAPLPEGTSVTFERGRLLDEQPVPAFLANGSDLDLGLAALGQGITGVGELLRVTVPGVEELNPAVEARASDNSIIELNLATGVSNMPTALALGQNHPNPFNPSTTIKFDLPAQGRVDLKVYALDGSLVRTLVSEVMDPGHHDVVWYGRDDSGRQAATGTYFYRMVVDGKTLVHKMTLMK